MFLGLWSASTITRNKVFGNDYDYDYDDGVGGNSLGRDGGEEEEEEEEEECCITNNNWNAAQLFCFVLQTNCGVGAGVG